jgi:hypothetical protein
MRRFGLACIFLGPVALMSCSPANGPDATEGPLGTAQSAIAYGSADTTHTAVVALLGNAGGGSFDECSGTIVQVKNGSGYVLTAAHCCNMTQPGLVVMSSDYTVGENYLGGGTPAPPVYAVTAGSVWYDSKYDGQEYDFCMLQFAAPANAAVIPVAQPGDDGLSLNVEVEHVGYGVTDTTTNNSGRRTGTAPVDQSLTTLILQSTQGGTSHIQGVCEGDSGGPALTPAGAPQAQQKVAGTTSYGDSSTCATNSMNVCMRVTSETGPGGFITNYLADTPSGTQAGSATATCQTCATASETGACSTQTQACVNDAACTTLNTCLGNCTTQACATACDTTAGTTAQNELNALNTCICNTACVSECSSECGGTTTTTTGGGATCGLTSSDADCNTCLDTSCCSQASACAADSNCTPCLGTSTPPPSCSSDAALAALTTCIDTNCASTCGGSGGSTSASTTGSAATTGSGTPSSTGSAATGAGGGAGNGAGGAGSAGTATGGSGSNESVGCSVAAPRGDAPGAPASLAGLLLGTALAFSRRKRV